MPAVVPAHAKLHRTYLINLISMHLIAIIIILIIIIITTKYLKHWLFVDNVLFYFVNVRTVLLDAKKQQN